MVLMIDGYTILRYVHWLFYQFTRENYNFDQHAASCFKRKETTAAHMTLGEVY